MYVIVHTYRPLLAACVRAPEAFCAGLNREPCSLRADTCGPCYPRHVTVSGDGEDTFSNEPCFGEEGMVCTCMCKSCAYILCIYGA